MTDLRPVLARLGPADAERFLAEYASRVGEAFPPVSLGGRTVQMRPNRRIFAVGCKPRRESAGLGQAPRSAGQRGHVEVLLELAESEHEIGDALELGGAYGGREGAGCHGVGDFEVTCRAWLMAWCRAAGLVAASVLPCCRARVKAAAVFGYWWYHCWVTT
jgi:hypothetical protein